MYEIFFKYTGAAIVTTILSKFLISLISISNLRMNFVLNGVVTLGLYAVLIFFTVILFDKAFLKEISILRR